MKKQLKGSLLLLLATVIWGSAFVAQSVGMDHIGPFTFQAARCGYGVAGLIPIIFLMDLGKQDGKTFVSRWKEPQLWKAGLFCGIALFVATGTQQMGMVYTDPGKAGFITAMYIVIVPVIGFFLGQKAGWKIWVSVAMAVAGLYLLSAVGVSQVNIGDIYIMACAVAFAVQIVLVDRMGKRLDGLRLNFVQFLVNGILSALFMFLTEQPKLDSILACTGPLLYTGILSSGIAYSLQIIGQQNISPDRASLIMSLESVFAVLSCWLVLNQRLTGPEALGCCLVFAGVILSQLPEKIKAPS